MDKPHETYRVSGKRPIVDAIAHAIELGGGRILERASPGVAPFPFTVLLPSGEIVRLLCYAFLANQYRQAGRPKDEHRFQVKYGSDFQRYHRIYVAPESERLTLMFGVHLDQGVFVAVDPAMHAVTWFSKSVEFKGHRVEDAKTRSWVAWERERVLLGRRRRAVAQPDAGLEEMNAQDEALLGFTPERFLQYVQFERLATGLPTGERVLLAEKIGAAIATKPAGGKLHPLEEELGMSAYEILDLIGSAFRLKVAVRGNAAENHLLSLVRAMPGVTEALPIDKDGQPDLQVEFLHRTRHALIECKTVGRTPTRRGPKVDFQKTRAAKGNPCSRYYQAEQFDILAACMHPISERWDDFRFCLTQDLDSHQECADRLDHRVYVGGERWERGLPDLLDRIST